ncbi:uncharacterized protein LOC117511770 isoform X2 [Thalassophryne amazonica]|uniref:uncharacterized protein LOC117511770 isoform X2 n=1 Tax=Thalassophryne amazonica TaxID=390379 RepID=UPI0014721AF8|nr:uncharacterized protein LOC117511770 isoform X2 [Thalassophryne amazonica]
MSCGCVLKNTPARFMRTLENKKNVVADYIQWYFINKNYLSIQSETRLTADAVENIFNVQFSHLAAPGLERKQEYGATALCGSSLNGPGDCHHHIELAECHQTGAGLPETLGIHNLLHRTFRSEDFQLVPM